MRCVIARTSQLHASLTQTTFIAVKPDGVNRRLVGKIIQRFEEKGFQLVAMKMIQPPRELVEEHYAEHKGKGFYNGLVDYLCGGPVVAMQWKGKGVIARSRAMMGATKDAAPGTIRGDFSIEVGRNLVHGSDCAEAAEREIKLWFGEDKINYEDACEKWIYE
ncbi:Nucleoside diphosphate kinase [Carpediemonas membranifera]|uniref:nucleoside-diphosphate kinase n=1 Tax=Carpediemonas membranifera TaxID=201153 RepID=A0A8J6E8Z9_9EUKA|nr:Nucleoside diphosphate kinase [Carpediemonas membranifera]|eukprot:KAG9392620.1 Nucleoside diphosphate kinase [Carpediemonas membranifera]